MKLRNIYLSLVLILAGLVSIDLVNAMDRDGSGDVRMVTDEDKCHHEFRGARDVLVCDTCDKVRVPEDETICNDCLVDNLRQDRMATRIANMLTSEQANRILPG